LALGQEKKKLKTLGKKTGKIPGKVQRGIPGGRVMQCTEGWMSTKKIRPTGGWGGDPH